MATIEKERAVAVRAAFDRSLAKVDALVGVVTPGQLGDRSMVRAAHHLVGWAISADSSFGSIARFLAFWHSMSRLLQVCPMGRYCILPPLVLAPPNCLDGDRSWSTLRPRCLDGT